jgi:hypothetical protein
MTPLPMDSQASSETDWSDPKVRERHLVSAISIALKYEHLGRAAHESLESALKRIGYRFDGRSQEWVPKEAPRQ